MSEPKSSRTVVVTHRTGLHARPAAMIADLARRFDATIELVKGHERAKASDVLHILALGAARGERLVLEGRGPEAEQALDALVRLFAGQFFEDT